MKTGIVLVLLSLLAGAAAAANLDPAYTKAFGTAVIIASSKGYPAISAYDASQFDYRNGKFYIGGGEGATVNLRVLYPAGVNAGSVVAKVKKEQPGNLKHFKRDVSMWKIWCDHSYGGDLLVDDQHPWPKNRNDEPAWAEPLARLDNNITPESRQFQSMGCLWDDLKQYLASTMAKVPPGTRFYVTLQFGYEYLVPGGQMETKWDDVKRKWVQVKSQGLLGYSLSDPVAAGTFEIAGE